VAQVPAQTISQRPDVFAAERDVVVASANIASAQAQRWPRLTLNGSIGALRYSSAGTDTDMTTWSFGPLALNLPLFDAGQRAANVAASQANYAQSVVAYRAKVRAAVREVEDALVSLQSAQARRSDAALALQGYAQAVESSSQRYQSGMASLLDLEEARRYALSAESALDALHLERQRAWVSLYRAAGGGWDNEGKPAEGTQADSAPGLKSAP
jgi:outer membrane protein TolC